MSSAPTATGRAPSAVSAAKVARVAEPALMASSTIGDGPAAQVIVKGVGDGVGHAFGSHPALGEGEAEVELGRDHLSDECAANQRADRGLDAMPA